MALATSLGEASMCTRSSYLGLVGRPRFAGPCLCGFLVMVRLSKEQIFERRLAYFPYLIVGVVIPAETASLAIP